MIGLPAARPTRSSQRSTYWQVVVAAVVALCLSGTSALAVLPHPFQAAVNAFDDRLAQGSSTTTDVALGQAVEDTLRRYLEQEFPKNTPDQVAEAFVQNLILRFQSMTDAEVGAFRADFVNYAADVAAQREPALVPRLNSIFNVVAFATIADDDRWQRAAGDQTSEWGRLPGSQMRRLGQPQGWFNTEAEWRKVTERFKAFDAARRKAYQYPTSEFYGDPADQRAQEGLPGILATTPRSTWVKVFEQRLAILYANLGIALPKDVRHDLAELQYVMVGWQGQNGPERVATAALRPLEDALRQGRRLEDILRQREDEYGFREDHPIPTRVLSLRDFSLLLRAAYMLRDIGVPLVHGELTHDIQWLAVIADYEDNPNEYIHVPIEIFSQIGAYDAQLDALANERFGFERPLYSLWAMLFDFPNENLALRDFSHANGVRELVASEPSLRELSRALEARYNARILAAGVFFRAWLANRGDPAGLADKLPFVTPELSAQLERAYAVYNNPDAAGRAARAENLGDRLYLAYRYAQARASQNYQLSKMPDANGAPRDVPVMMPDGQPLMDNSTDPAFQGEIARQYERRRVALFGDQPAPPAPRQRTGGSR